MNRRRACRYGLQGAPREGVWSVRPPIVSAPSLVPRVHEQSRRRARVERFQLVEALPRNRNTLAGAVRMASRRGERGGDADPGRRRASFTSPANSRPRADVDRPSSGSNDVGSPPPPPRSRRCRGATEDDGRHAFAGLPTRVRGRRCSLAATDDSCERAAATRARSPRRPLLRRSRDARQLASAPRASDRVPPARRSPRSVSEGRSQPRAETRGHENPIRSTPKHHVAVDHRASANCAAMRNASWRRRDARAATVIARMISARITRQRSTSGTAHRRSGERATAATSRDASRARRRSATPSPG